MKHVLNLLARVVQGVSIFYSDTEQDRPNVIRARVLDPGMQGLLQQVNDFRKDRHRVLFRTQNTHSLHHWTSLVAFAEAM